jgi:hypothetical protein
VLSIPEATERRDMGAFGVKWLVRLFVCYQVVGKLEQE